MTLSELAAAAAVARPPSDQPYLLMLDARALEAAGILPSIRDLAQRWGVSSSSAYRILKRARSLPLRIEVSHE